MNRRDPDIFWLGEKREGYGVEIWYRKLEYANSATIGSWLIHFPRLHAFWEWWAASLVTLADIPGVPPAHKQFPEAKFELIVFTIDPNTCPDPDPEALTYPWLTPIDVAAQFDAETNQDALQVCTAAMLACCMGVLPPDSDFRSRWKPWLDREVAMQRKAKGEER